MIFVLFVDSASGWIFQQEITFLFDFLKFFFLKILWSSIPKATNDSTLLTNGRKYLVPYSMHIMQMCGFGEFPDTIQSVYAAGAVESTNVTEVQCSCPLVLGLLYICLSCYRDVSYTQTPSLKMYQITMLHPSPLVNATWSKVHHAMSWYFASITTWCLVRLYRINQEVFTCMHGWKRTSVFHLMLLLSNHA